MTLSFRNRSSPGLFGDKEWESLSNCITWHLQCSWIRPRYLETHFKFILISVNFILLPMLTLLVSSLSGNPRPAIIICKMGIWPHLKVSFSVFSLSLCWEPPVSPISYLGFSGIRSHQIHIRSMIESKC